MAARAKLTQPKCKLCSSPKRAEIDAILERRSKREVKTDDALAMIEALGIENPNLDNIKSHLGQKKNEAHTIFISGEQGEKEDAVAAAVSEEKLRIFERILGPDRRDETPSPEQLLEIHRALYAFELEERVKAGLPVDLTHDQVLKAIGEGTKRKQNEAVDELMGGLGAALGAWAGSKMDEALDSPRVIDHEPIEDAEVKELPRG